MPMHNALACALTAGLVAVTGCATQPDPCTADWIEWKTEKILTPFARSHSGTVRLLRDLSDQADAPDMLMAVRIAASMDDFEALAEDFDRSVLPQLNEALDQCGQSQHFVPAFSAFLRKQGVGEDIIAWVEVIGYVALEERRR